MLIERLMRALVVELFAEAIEFPLLGREVPAVGRVASALSVLERVLFPGLDGLSQWLKRYFTTPK